MRIAHRFYQTAPKRAGRKLPSLPATKGQSRKVRCAFTGNPTLETRSELLLSRLFRNFDDGGTLSVRIRLSFRKHSGKIDVKYKGQPMDLDYQGSRKGA